jgi:hypothetical protein
MAELLAPRFFAVWRPQLDGMGLDFDHIPSMV